MLLPAHRAVLMGGTRALMRRNLAAHFDAGLGITAAGGFASQWDDVSGNARHLLQATGANQPIHLPYVGEKHGWLPGVTGNYFSTPDSVAASVTGDAAWVVESALTDWTPTAFQPLISKRTINSYQLTITPLDSSAAGTVRLNWWDSGGTLRVAESTSIAPGIDAQKLFVAATLDVDNGGGGNTVKFFTSTDGATWTQLGNAVAQGFVTSVRDTTDAVRIGSDGSTGVSAGKFYSAQIYNGIPPMLGGAGSANPVVDFNPNRDYASGLTFFSSTTGETYTINSAGSKPAQIVDRPSLLFDGAAHFMKCAAFTLNQPETVYLVAKPVSWTSTDSIMDGNTNNGMRIIQTGVSPEIVLSAGSNAASNTGFVVGAAAVLCATFDGASSRIQINNNAATSGSAGANNAGGFCLGAQGDGAGTYANIQAHEALIYNVAHTASERASIIRALMNKWGVA